MAIMTWTRERRCKDCMNLRYFYPNPNKFYKRHRCIAYNLPENLNSIRAITCVDFEWNHTAIPYYIDYQTENK
ncbi:MAG: hypothetical protein M0R37_13010 [Bacteroidales bacterium]|nr:hypothetical protein [Bacteroidales bacterium]